MSGTGFFMLFWWVGINANPSSLLLIGTDVTATVTADLTIRDCRRSGLPMSRSRLQITILSQLEGSKSG